SPHSSSTWWITPTSRHVRKPKPWPHGSTIPTPQPQPSQPGCTTNRYNSMQRLSGTDQALHVLNGKLVRETTGQNPFVSPRENFDIRSFRSDSVRVASRSIQDL